MSTPITLYAAGNQIRSVNERKQAVGIESNSEEHNCVYGHTYTIIDDAYYSK